MRRLLLPLSALILAVAAAAFAEAALAAHNDDSEQPKEEPAPETPGKLTLTLNPGGHTATVSKVFFTPDSQQVITAAMDHSIRIWDARSGESVKVLYPPGFGGLAAAALSPDGKTLAVGSRYAEGEKTLHLIYLMALADGRIERVLKGHPQAIEALAFSADGKRLASTSAGAKPDGTVRIWNVATAEQENVFPFFGDALVRQARRGLAFSPDGSQLARVRLSGGSGSILDLATGKVVAKINGVGPVAWSPDGKTLATRMTEATGRGIMLWNPDGTERLRVLPEKEVYCHGVAFSADSRTLLVTWGHLDWPQAGIVDAATGKLLVKSAAKHANRDGALSSDGQLAATTANAVSGIHGLTVWRTADGGVVKKAWLAPSMYKVSQRTGWSADGKVVTWAGPGNRHTFNLAQLEFAAALSREDIHGPVHKQGALSLDKLKVLKNGTTLATLKGYLPTLVGTDRAASSLASGAIVLCDAASGKEIRRFHGHHDELNDLVPSPDGRFLLSTSMDQTLKIWSAERDRALLSLYVKGSDWVAWTEEGYYAATPGGERLMGWKVDNGIDKAPSYYPAERFRKQLYRPDVIKRLLEKGSVQEALKTADAALGKKTQLANLEELLPPQAALAVLDQAALPKVKLRARATASGKGQPVTALRLLVDGRPLPEGAGHAEFKGEPNAAAEWEVTLPPGKHSLAVLARSPDASSVSEAVEVVCPAPARQAVLHVLAVGIDTYEAPIPKLQFAAADAQAITDAFTQNCKGALFPKVVAKALLDQKASRPSVLAELAQLRKAVNANDLVVVYFAGHGVKEADKFYLLTVEAQLQNLPKTALSGEDLRKALGEFPCQVLLLLDACHSAAGLKDFRPAVDDATRTLSDDEVGVAVLCAAMAHEKALERSGHGLFTRAVVEALGQADGVPFNRRDHRLYVHHLHSYVLDEVQAGSEDRQHPSLSLPSAGESFPLTQFVRKPPPSR